MADLTINQALKKGAEAQKAGQVRDAERYYTAILKEQPKHSVANHNMGVLAVSAGKVSEALPFFKTALEVNESMPQFWLSYIHALVLLDRLQDARAVIYQAREKDIQDDGLENLAERLSISKVSNKNGLKYANERPNILDSIKLDEAIRLAKKSVKGGSSDKAKEIYEDILVKFPKNKKAKEGLNLLSRQNSLQTKISMDPDQNQIKSLTDLYGQGQFQEALIGIESLSKQFPSSAILYNIKGAVLRGLGQLELSLEAYQKALSIKPDFVEALNNMGIILKDQGKLEEAIEAYKRALSINSDYVGSRYNMANCLKMIGKLDEAINAYDRIKNSSDAISLSLECLYALERFDEFNRRLADISLKDPNNIRVAAMSAFAAHQLKQSDIFPFCKDPLSMIHKSSIKGYLPNCDEFISNFLVELNSANQTWEPDGQTTKGGFQTASKLFSVATPNTMLLQEILKEELSVFKEKFRHKDSLLIKNWPEEIKFAAWYVRLLKGGHQGSHIHPKGWVSGVLYLKTVVDPVESEGAIKFGLHGYDYPTKDKELPIKVHQPVDGDLVLFPSSLFHETIPVQQSVERCVVAFDLLP